MPKLATPVSSLFKDAAIAREILSVSRFLEGRDNGPFMDASVQRAYHFEHDIVHLWTGQEKDGIISKIGTLPNLDLITFHMASACSDPVLKNGIFERGGKSFSRDELLKNASENVKWLKSALSPYTIDVAVENNNYYPTAAYDHITEPGFIREVITKNSLTFLFDIAHALITAHNKKESYKNYIDALPMDKMIQVHVSKYAVADTGLAYDAHELPDESLFQEVKSVVNRHDPRYITIEYYNDKDALIGALKKFDRLCTAEKR